MIHLVGADATAVPDWFKRRLKDIDPGLVCYWNQFQRKFCIDRVVKDETGEHQTNVMLIPAISERFLDELKGMDAWTKYGSLEKLRATHEQAKADFDAKAEKDMKDDMHHAAMDNKRLMTEAHNLIQRHNLHTKPQ
jgi:hypothetical protein